MRSERSPFFICLVTLAPALLACDPSSTGAGCPVADGCGASPFGQWQHVCDDALDELTITVSQDGEVIVDCKLELIEHDLLESASLTLVEDGSYTGEKSLTGTWRARAQRACLGGGVCADVADLGSFGVDECHETAEGCICSGVADQHSSTRGFVIYGARTASFDEDGSYDLCVGPTVMTLSRVDEALVFRRGATP